MSSLQLAPKQWEAIKERIIQDYGKTSILVSWVLKRELGFTFREHWPGDYCAGTVIYLDFYDESAMTMFRLKYL